MNSIEKINAEKVRTAEKFAAENRAKMFRGEAMFLDILTEQNVLMDYQVPIYIKNRDGRIENFYIVDFLDEFLGLIIEIDGSYHSGELQKAKDVQRDKDLQKLGYKIYRITMDDLRSGRVWKKLYLIYMEEGIDIFAKDKINSDI